METRNYQSGEINRIITFGAAIYACTDNGVYKVRLDYGKKIANFVSYIKVHNVSTMSYENKTNSFYLGTWDHGIYSYNLLTRELTNIETSRERIINQIFIDKDSGIWAATNSGAFLHSSSLFKIINLSEIHHNPFPYIAKIRHASKKVYFLIQSGLYSLEFDLRNSYSISKIPVPFENKLHDFELKNDIFYLSFRDGIITAYKGDRLRYKVSLENDRLRNLYVDNEGDLWGSTEISNDVIRITKEGAISRFSLGNDNPLLIEVIKQGTDGKIYVAGNGESMMYSFDSSENAFHPVKITSKNFESDDLHIFDIEFFDKFILLATNLGFVTCENGEMFLFGLNKQNENVTMRSIFRTKDDQIWIGSDKGLYVRFNQELVNFNSLDGLPNTSISKHGIIQDEKGRIWVATASGLSYFTHRQGEVRTSSKPKIIAAYSSHKKTTVHSYGLETINPGAVTIKYSDLSYPTNRTLFQTRVFGLNSEWLDRGNANAVHYSALPVGEYMFQVRSKRPGYLWSDPVSFSIVISAPWYRSLWMYIFYTFLAVLLLLFIVNKIHNKRIAYLMRREDELKRLVKDKTQLLLDEMDLSEKLLEKTILAKERLERANDVKGQLLSVAAHDLRNPLHVIMGYKDLLKAEIKDNSEAKEMLDNISESASRMNTLISNILESASRDSERIEIVTQKINISNLAKESLHENRIRAGQKEQTIISEISEDIFAKADSNWLKEAIDNLLSNAIKYSEPNKRIWLSVNESIASVVISVKDEGPGISEDDQKIMFGKFQRLSAKPTGGESSTGLGLFIVKDVIERHGGIITCESSLGKGSIFSIKLPKAK